MSDLRTLLTAFCVNQRGADQSRRSHEDILIKKRISDEQVISILREAEAGVSARELCRKNAMSDATF